MKTTLAALLAAALLGGCVVTPLPPAVAPPPAYAPAYVYPPPVVLGPPRAYAAPPAVVVAPGWRYRGPGGWWRPYRDPRW